MVVANSMDSFWLVYCILNSPESTVTVERSDGLPVKFVAYQDLSAAVSPMESGTLPTDIPSLLAYEKVVASLHHEHTVVPMRYGCQMQGEAGVVALLRQHAQEYRSTITAMHGCVEIGIRVIVDSDEGGIANDAAKAWDCRLGRDYLNNRKCFYAEQERMSKKHEKLTAKFIETLQGLFVKCKTEHTNDRSLFKVPILSFYFLVKREHAADFRQTFGRLKAQASCKMLLTGPWPPYNFV